MTLAGFPDKWSPFNNNFRFLFDWPTFLKLLQTEEALWDCCSGFLLLPSPDQQRQITGDITTSSVNSLQAAAQLTKQFQHRQNIITLQM